MAAVDPQGRVISSKRIHTPADANRLLDWVARSVRDVATSSIPRADSLACLGVALPGIVDPLTGVLIRSLNLPALEGTRVRGELEQKTGRRVVLVTDAEAATWGEYVARGGPSACFAHLRLGTGIACGLVKDGRLVPTDTDRRTHWELLVVDRTNDGPPCPCGLYGCLDLYASGRALEKRSRAAGLSDGVSALQAAIVAGRGEAIRIVRDAARAVVTTIENLARERGVSGIVVGGGVIERFPSLLGEVQSILDSSSDEGPRRTGITVGSSRLGDDAGVIGAALLANTGFQNH